MKTTFPLFIKHIFPALALFILVLAGGVFYTYPILEIIKALSYIPQDVNDSIILLTSGGVNWFVEWEVSVLVFQWISVCCLIICWWRASYTMKYFPVWKWWFWAYCALIFPVSLVLIGLIALSYLFRGLAWSIGGRWRRAHKVRVTDHESFCASLQNELSAVRASWEEFFPPRYAMATVPVLEERVLNLRGKLQDLGGEMERVEREFSEAQASLLALRDGEPCHNNSLDTAVFKKVWKGELETLIKNPHIKGLKIQDGSLEIYTGTFKTFIGKYGPVKIVINLADLEKSFSVSLAYDNSWRGNVGSFGGYSSGFCFGDNRQFIHDLIKEGKISEAFGLMVAAFEGSGGMP